MHTESIEREKTSTTIEYELLTTHIDDFEQMSYTTYGIRARDERGTVVFDCTDISTSKKFVQDFVDLVSERDVSPLHIEDILEDYLE